MLNITPAGGAGGGVEEGWGAPSWREATRHLEWCWVSRGGGGGIDGKALLARREGAAVGDWHGSACPHHIHDVLERTAPARQWGLLRRRVPGNVAAGQQGRRRRRGGGGAVLLDVGLALSDVGVLDSHPDASEDQRVRLEMLHRRHRVGIRVEVDECSGRVVSVPPHRQPDALDPACWWWGRERVSESAACGSRQEGVPRAS